MSMEEVKTVNEVITIEGIIEAHKKSLKMVPVQINDLTVHIPVFFNMTALRKYQETYEVTKDYREAFCIVVYTMFNNNKKYVDDLNNSWELTLEEIRSISDSDMNEIVEMIINTSKDLKNYYENNSSINFYERFHNAVSKQMDELGKVIGKAMKPAIDSFAQIQNTIKNTISPGLNSLFSSIENMKNIETSYENVKPFNILDYKPIQQSTDIKLLHVENPVVKTNNLLEDMVEELMQLRDIQIEQFQSSIKVSESIANILLEEQRTRLVKDEEERIYREKIEVQEKRNLKISIAVLLITIVALIVSTLSFIGFERLFSL